MASNSNHTKRSTIISISIADDAAASWYCAVVLVALIILTSSLFMAIDIIIALDVRERNNNNNNNQQQLMMIFKNLPPCDEIYVVGEGETLQTIGDKCGDPFIVEHNPHIHDPDDVFPGLVIKITPAKT